MCNPAGRAVGIHQGMTEQSCDNIHQSDTDNINGQVNEISFQRNTNKRATLVGFKGWTHIRDDGGDPNEGHRCVSCLPSFAGMTEQ